MNEELHSAVRSSNGAVARVIDILFGRQVEVEEKESPMARSRCWINIRIVDS